MATGAHRSLDDFFDAAVSSYRERMEALDEYLEAQEGCRDSREELIRHAVCHVVVIADDDD
jgi:hypothetical protein